MKHQHNTVHHWRRWLFMAFPPLAAVLCALVLVMPAWAATVTNIRFPIRGTGVMNPWNGETLTFNGECHTQGRVTLESSGGLHTGFHNNMHVTATGNQGNTSIANEEDYSQFHGRVGVEQIYTSSLTASSTGISAELRSA